MFDLRLSARVLGPPTRDDGQHVTRDVQECRDLGDQPVDVRHAARLRYRGQAIAAAELFVLGDDELLGGRLHHDVNDRVEVGLPQSDPHCCRQRLGMPVDICRGELRFERLVRGPGLARASEFRQDGNRLTGRLELGLVIAQPVPSLLLLAATIHGPSLALAGRVPGYLRRSALTGTTPSPRIRRRDRRGRA